MTSKQSQIYLGFIFAIVSAALFAIRPIFVKLVYAEGVDSATLLVLRMLFSAPFYAGLLYYFLRSPEQRHKLSTTLIFHSSIVGLVGYYGASLLDLLGLQYVTAQLGRMVLYSYPTLVVLLGALFFSKPLTLRIIISLAITYFGVAIIFGHDLKYFGSDIINGGLLISGSAILFAFYLLMSKPLIDKLGSQVFTCIALLSASAGIVAHFLLTHNISDIGHVNNNALALIMVIAIVCTVIPTFCTTAAVARIGADRTGITSMIGPVFTSIFAVTLLSEAFTPYHLLGIIFIVAGVFVLQKN